MTKAQSDGLSLAPWCRATAARAPRPVARRARTGRRARTAESQMEDGGNLFRREAAERPFDAAIRAGYEGSAWRRECGDRGRHWRHTHGDTLYHQRRHADIRYCGRAACQAAGRRS